MEDALGSALARLAPAASNVVSDPSVEHFEQLKSACTGALAVARGQGTLGPAQQKSLWGAASRLWNASIEVAPPGSSAEGSEESGGGGDGGVRGVAALVQAACDLCAPIAPGILLPQETVSLVRFHYRAGQAWAALGEYEAGEAALARGVEAAQALLPLCFERRGRGPLHQECADLLFRLMLERLRAALRLDQQMLSSGLVSQAQAFAGDQRLPASEGVALRMHLIRVLHEQGERLVKARQPGAAKNLLSAAYETLSQLELGGEDAETAAVGAEAQARGAQVLSLLALCNIEVGEAEHAMACLQALRQVGDPQAATHFSTSFLTLRVLLQLGKAGEAEGELINLVSHEDATPEACLAGLQAALAAPGGVPLARSALGLVLERFAEEPGICVELVQAALAQPGTAAGAGSAGTGGGAADAEGSAEHLVAADNLVLDLVGDDRLLERVCEEAGLRRELLGLLWNHAVAALQIRGAFDTALAFFSAAAPLLEEGGSSATQAEAASSSAVEPTLVGCRRAQALCCMGARQLDKALEFLAAADEVPQPACSAPITTMLRLSVHLEAGDQAGATAAVAALAACPGAQPDALRIACIQCVDAGAREAARQALACLLERCSSMDSSSAGAADASSATAAGGLGSPGYEATVFQNLIKLVLEDQEAAAGPPAAAAAAVDNKTSDAASCAGSEAADGGQAVPGALPGGGSAELARLFDLLVERMQAVGADAFFAQQDGRSMQQEWFATTAWNAGQKAGAASELQQAAVLMAVCGELLAALPVPTTGTVQKQKMAFLMAAASACDVHEQTAAKLAASGEAGAEQGAGGNSSSLKLARSYLQQARAAVISMQTQQAVLGGDPGGQAGGDPKSDVYLLLLDFKLCHLSQDVPSQLEVLERARALPAFGAEHFGMVADLARLPGAPGGQRCLDVCRAAEQARLQRLTQQVPLDVSAAAQAIRSLMDLSPGDADKLQLLGEASGLMSVGAPGTYPVQELRWLVTTAWNRGAVHARFGRAAEAERYQRWACEALRHSEQLEREHKEMMQGELARTSAAALTAQQAHHPVLAA